MIFSAVLLNAFFLVLLYRHLTARSRAQVEPVPTPHQCAHCWRTYREDYIRDLHVRAAHPSTHQRDQGEHVVVMRGGSPVTLRPYVDG